MGFSAHVNQFRLCASDTLLAPFDKNFIGLERLTSAVIVTRTRESDLDRVLFLQTDGIFAALSNE